MDTEYKLKTKLSYRNVIYNLILIIKRINAIINILKYTDSSAYQYFGLFSNLCNHLLRSNNFKSYDVYMELVNYVLFICTIRLKKDLINEIHTKISYIYSYVEMLRRKYFNDVFFSKLVNEFYKNSRNCSIEVYKYYKYIYQNIIHSMSFTYEYFYLVSLVDYVFDISDDGKKIIINKKFNPINDIKKYENNNSLNVQSDLQFIINYETISNRKLIIDRVIDSIYVVKNLIVIKQILDNNSTSTVVKKFIKSCNIVRTLQIIGKLNNKMYYDNIKKNFKLSSLFKRSIYNNNNINNNSNQVKRKGILSSMLFRRANENEIIKKRKKVEEICHELIIISEDDSSRTSNSSSDDSEDDLPLSDREGYKMFIE